VHSGKFSTFPTPGQARSFRVGVGSCARTHSNALAFQKLVDAKLDLFIHMGDMHYENIDTANQRRFDVAYQSVFKQPRYRALLSSQAVAYTYDDHDFGPNDANGRSVTADVARASYRKNVPHYDLVAKPIYQSWPVGRVLFIMTDIVSESTKNGPKMSEVQTKWFFSELKRGRDHFKLIVWVSSKPWIGKASSKSDAWLGESSGRERISNFIADNQITSLIVVAGDAHMIAIDNGRNTDYTTDHTNGTSRQAAGFPILQAAPFAKGGSTKGGPFSHGCHAYKLHDNSHYGILDVTDSGGDQLCVRMAGYRADQSNAVMEYTTCLPTVRFGKTGGGQGSCAIQLLPMWPLILMVTMLVVILFNIVFYFVIPYFFSHTRVAKTYRISNNTRRAGVVAIGVTFVICFISNLLLGLKAWYGFQVLLLVALFLPVTHVVMVKRRNRRRSFQYSSDGLGAAHGPSKFELKAAKSASVDVQDVDPGVAVA
jgi:hypothetical protein